MAERAGQAETRRELLSAATGRTLEIGAGTGYFATRLAHMVPKGRVYAVDTEPDMVKHLGERAKRDGLKNLSAVAGAPKAASKGSSGTSISRLR